jgi:hypothetical protein
MLVGLTVAVLILQQQDVALLAAAYIDVALIRNGNDAAVTKPLRKRLDGEPFRHFQLSNPVARRRQLIRFEDVDGDLDFRTVALLSRSLVGH